MFDGCLWMEKNEGVMKFKHPRVKRNLPEKTTHQKIKNISKVPKSAVFFNSQCGYKKYIYIFFFWGGGGIPEICTTLYLPYMVFCCA